MLDNDQPAAIPTTDEEAKAALRAHIQRYYRAPFQLVIANVIGIYECYRKLDYTIANAYLEGLRALLPPELRNLGRDNAK